jgi:hypothetical protein
MALRKDNDRMKGFVDKINKTEPKKSYGFIPPAITKKHIKQTLREHDKRSGKPHVPSKNLYPEKGNPAIEMVAAPHEYLLGPGPVKAASKVAKTGFDLSKNIITKAPSITKKLITKGMNYVKKQGEKIAMDIGVGVAADKISKK